jgi:hypothetical protein
MVLDDTNRLTPYHVIYGWQSDDSVFSYKEKVPSEEKS